MYFLTVFSLIDIIGENLRLTYCIHLMTVDELQVGQEIEVRPGIVAKDQDGKWACKPIRSKILSLLAEQNDLQYAVPGGLIGKSCSNS